MAYFDAWAFGPEEQRRALMNAIFAPGGEFIYWAVSMALGGLMQWLVLRGQVQWARWCVLPVPLFFGFIGLIDPDPLHVGGGITLIAFHVKDFALAGTFCGAVVGIPLVLLLRRSYRKSKRDGNASL